MRTDRFVVIDALYSISKHFGDGDNTNFGTFIGIERNGIIKIVPSSLIFTFLTLPDTGCNHCTTLIAPFIIKSAECKAFAVCHIINHNDIFVLSPMMLILHHVGFSRVL